MWTFHVEEKIINLYYDINTAQARHLSLWDDIEWYVQKLKESRTGLNKGFGINGTSCRWDKFMNLSYIFYFR